MDLRYNLYSENVCMGSKLNESVDKTDSPVQTITQLKQKTRTEKNLAGSYKVNRRVQCDSHSQRHKFSKVQK